MPTIKVRLDDGTFYPLPTLIGPRGLSAYEIAVTQGGFIGTIEEWLKSLVGPQGIQGVQGVQGIQGIQGPQGPAGVPGNYYQFIFQLTSSNTAPTTPTSPNDSIPAGWSAYPLSISESLPYLWLSVRQKINNIWLSFSSPSLLSTYVQGGGGTSISQATSSTLGGIKANSRTTESVEVKIDDTTGFLYVASSGGSGGGIADVPLDTVSPKLYGRYSGDQTWKEILPPAGSVGTLQQVTTNGATSDKLLGLSGGIKVGNILQIPNTAPSNVDAGHIALFSSDSGFDSTPPPILPIASASTLGAIKVGANLSIDPITGVLSATSSGVGSGGVTVHNGLSGRDTADCHPTTAITGLDASLTMLTQNWVQLDYSLSLLASNVNNKLDTTHATDANAHSTLFAAKANKNGSATEDFATKNLTVNGTATMVENINTNLRIPKSPPTNPTLGEFYLYIE